MGELFQEQLEALRARSLERKLRETSSAQGPEVQIAGRRLINFSSNDYLGLAGDSRLCEAAIGAIREFGVGAGASRLVSGTQSPHLRLENALAKWKQAEAALSFSSGYAAAFGTVPALVSKDDVILLDKLCHASLIDGAKLSGATLRVFPHNHLGKLEEHLEWVRRQHPGKRILILTESVFSMDGDRAPLRELIELKKRFGALLMLDEAHAVGVIGPNGRGLAAAQNLSDDVDVQMGTLSKALGASGGYICGSRSLIEWLINRARSFIYSTAPPPAIVAAALAAVNFLGSSEGEERRRLLWERIGLMKDLLPRNELNEKASVVNSAIFPWIVGDEQAAIDLAASLQSEGFLVPAIRYPTVAKGSARLRITVTASHGENQIRSLCGAIKRANERRAED
ncbi:MAG: 8-amino-7-oxononanoate synthase [Verrucomicrobia bacterium]|nr:MAG: 8-amino-7-oxononanoate synthase [Verrucomicrobiota bacterium]PYJ50274.1 MAG: 8-amino-7-oxononanoate synthase [Verrucomicrobiota bacterium]